MHSDPLRRDDSSAPESERLASIVAVGEVVWDLFEDGRRLGGAPLNFAAQARQLGHSAALISAVGTDPRGDEAAAMIAALELDCEYLQHSTRHPTGTAGIRLEADGSPSFALARPAAYDDLELAESTLERLRRNGPDWFYYGTVFAARPSGRSTLNRLLDTLDGSSRFFDPNLRPGSDTSDLVAELLEQADVVKLNADELDRVHALTGLPPTVEPFCHAAIERYGWRALAVTLGERGCAIICDGVYVEAPGQATAVVDTVGTGDAFAAAFLHGLIQGWPAPQIAVFSNRLAAEAAARPGGLPLSRNRSG